MAPILSFTAEEVWKYIPGESGKAESIHLTQFPALKKEYLDDALNDRWERIWEIRAVATKALEEARKEKVIVLSLDAQGHFYLSEKDYQFLQPYREDLKFIFIVSSVTLHPAGKGPAGGAKDEKEVRAEVLRAEGEKCERCWNYDVTVGRHEGHRTICHRCIETVQR